MTQDEKEKFKSDIIDTMRDVFISSHSVVVKNSSITGSDIAVIKEHIKNIDDRIKSIDEENKVRNGSVAKAINQFNTSISSLETSKSNIVTAFWWIGIFVTFIVLPIVGYISLEVLQLSKTVSAITK